VNRQIGAVVTHILSKIPPSHWILRARDSYTAKRVKSGLCYPPVNRPSFPPPTLGERRHRRLARRLVPVGGRAILIDGSCCRDVPPNWSRRPAWRKLSTVIRGSPPVGQTRPLLGKAVNGLRTAWPLDLWAYSAHRPRFRDARFLEPNSPAPSEISDLFRHPSPSDSGPPTTGS